MEYTMLGKTDCRVSRLGLGGAGSGMANYIHEFDPNQKKESLISLIQRAYELGVNFFDTAPGYGNGTGEKILGEALHPMPRSELIIATKVSLRSGNSVKESVESSLKNLRCSYIDLIQIHGDNYKAEECDKILKKDGIADEMERLKLEGVVKHIGFSAECQNSSLYRLIECGRFDVIQLEYNFLFQHPYDPNKKCGSLYDAKNQGMGTIAMRGATSGIFQKWIKEVNPENTFDYTPALIQFVMSNPLVDVVLLGVRSIEHLETNVAIASNIRKRIDIEKIHSRYE